MIVHQLTRASQRLASPFPICPPLLLFSESLQPLPSASYLGIVAAIFEAQHHWPNSWRHLSSSWYQVLGFLNRLVREIDFLHLRNSLSEHADAAEPLVAFRTAAYHAGSLALWESGSYLGFGILAERLAASHNGAPVVDWGRLADSAQSERHMPSTPLQDHSGTCAGPRGLSAPCTTDGRTSAQVDMKVLQSAHLLSTSSELILAVVASLERRWKHRTVIANVHLPRDASGGVTASAWHCKS